MTVVQRARLVLGVVAEIYLLRSLIGGEKKNVCGAKDTGRCSCSALM